MGKDSRGSAVYHKHRAVADIVVSIYVPFFFSHIGPWNLDFSEVRAMYCTLIK